MELGVWTVCVYRALYTRQESDPVCVLFCVFRPTLLREQHYQYLKKGLRHLSDAYEVRIIK